MSELQDLINEVKAAEAAESEVKLAPMPKMEIMADDSGIVKVPTYRYEDLLRSEFELTLLKGLIRTSTEYTVERNDIGDMERLTLFEMDFFQGLKAVAPDFYKSLLTPRR